LADAVVHEQTGLVVPEHDPDPVAHALARLLTDPVLADRLAAAARERVEERFLLQRNVGLLRQLFPDTSSAVAGP
jgi:glycosyltransferase involved in cell wall biosynthesis